MRGRPCTRGGFRRSWRQVSRGVLLACCLGLSGGVVLSSSAPALAQAMDHASQIVTVDRELLFRSSAYGQRLLIRLEQERRRLADETMELEQALEAEELELTQLRATLSAEEFRTRANAFDAKVEALRVEAAQAEQAFARHFESERVQFFEQIGPILGQLLREMGAVVIIDNAAVLLTARPIDITDQSVARIDAVLGDGSAQEEAPTDPSPQIAPEN